MSVDYLAAGGVFALVILGLLIVVGWNYREAGRLETDTNRIVQDRTQTVVSAALIAVVSALPPNLQTLNKQQWDALFPPMDARVKLERLSEDIKKIKNAISDSVVAGVVSAITAFLSGLFYEMNNNVYILTAIVAGISLYFYLFGGVFQIRRITAIERINDIISNSSSLGDLQSATVDALKKLM